MTIHDVKICILLLDDLMPDFEPMGDYDLLFVKALIGAQLTHPNLKIRHGVNLATKTFHMWKTPGPDFESLIREFDGVLISGGRYSTKDPVPWFPPLLYLIRQLVTEPSAAHIKLMGICLGHQLIAEAMGGTTGPARRYEIGAYDLALSSEGVRWWGRGQLNSLAIQQMHRDEVTSIPPDFIVLASTPDCAIHSMAKYSRNLPEDHPICQVLTLQGHFELDARTTGFLVDVRCWDGVITPEELAEARMRVIGAKSGRGDESDKAGWTVLDFMLQEVL